MQSLHLWKKIMKKKKNYEKEIFCFLKKIYLLNDPFYKS